MLDEDARVELREQKMRLDREFSIMLQKLSDRKDQLTNLEAKLQTLDRTSTSKGGRITRFRKKTCCFIGGATEGIRTNYKGKKGG